MVNRYKSMMFMAALLMMVTFFVHVFVGGPDHYAPLRQSDYTALDKSVFSVIWHFISALLLMMALTLCYLSRHRNRPLFLFILLTVLAFGTSFLIYGLIDFGSVWLMPQWVAFLGVATLMGGGATRL